MLTRLSIAAASIALLFSGQAQALDLSFTSFSIESGDGVSVPSTWRFDDIAPGTDGLMTLNTFANGASFNGADGVLTGGAGGVLGNDDIEIEIETFAILNSYAEFTLTFVDADTSNSKELTDLTMISYDIDNSDNADDYSDTLYIQGADSIFFENPTTLQVVPGAGDFAGFQVVTLIPPFTNYPEGGVSSNDSEAQKPVTVFFTYDAATSITWRWGTTGTDIDDRTRRMFLSGNAVFEAPEPGTVLLMGIGGMALGVVARRRS